jgi:hypothetical protein
MPPVSDNAEADAVALALALALGLTEEAALMGTAVEPAVADALVDALVDEDVCCARATDANSTTNMALTLDRSNTFFTPNTPSIEERGRAPQLRGLPVNKPLDCS